MLCEKCKKLTFTNLQQAKTVCFSMGFKGRIPAHQVGNSWMPGPTPDDLLKWCKSHCKAKPVEAKPVEAKTVEAKPVKVKSYKANKTKEEE